MMFLSMLQENPIVFIFAFTGIVLSLSFHEFAHAYVANKLGDPTAKYLGRVSINPLRHLDPIGTLLLLFVGFGWGKPVPFNPVNLTNPKRDSALISLAGPFANLVIAVVSALLVRFIPLPLVAAPFLFLMVVINLNLAVFNLLPFHPLDGFKVVAGVLPLNFYFQWMQMESYGMYILMFLVITGSTHFLVSPVVSFFMNLLGLTG